MSEHVPPCSIWQTLAVTSTRIRRHLPQNYRPVLDGSQARCYGVNKWLLSMEKEWSRSLLRSVEGVTGLTWVQKPVSLPSWELLTDSEIWVTHYLTDKGIQKVMCQKWQKPQKPRKKKSWPSQLPVSRLEQLSKLSSSPEAASPGQHSQVGKHQIW